MTVFVDTSAFYAALDSSDVNHEASREAWMALGEQQETLYTSNYVLVETTALLGRRLGIAAMRDFQAAFVPKLEVYWIQTIVHSAAMAALLTADNRDLSIVDCSSFEIMRLLGLNSALTFDKHFARQGFRCLPLGSCR